MSMITNVCVIFLPLFIACGFLIPKWRKVFTYFSPWTPLPALLMALFALPENPIAISWLLLEGRLGMDLTGKVFLFFTSLLWWLAGLYAYDYLPNDNRKTRFFLFYLLSLCGNIGLILAQDLMSFYLFFALMSFASFGLIVHSGTSAAQYAGKVYIILVIVGEMFIFSGLAFMVQNGGNMGFSDLPNDLVNWNLIAGLFLAGFGIKAGALPLHVWLPLAHPVAPTPASAILSGAIIKAGLLGSLRMLPLGEVSLPVWGILIIAIGLLGAFFGLLVGLTQNAPKTVLAYSSISQMGIMTIFIGVGLVEPHLWSYCWASLMLYATHHALAKGALFLSVGVASTSIQSPFFNFFRVTAILIPALAMAGVPFTSGALAKISLKYGLEEGILQHPWFGDISLFVNLASMGTVLLMFRFCWQVFLGKPGKAASKGMYLGMYLSWAALVASVLLLPILVIMQKYITVPGRESFFFSTWTGLWPLIFGGLIAVFALKRGWKKPFQIPEGDLIIFYAKVYYLFQSLIRCLVELLLETKASFATILWNLRFKRSKWKAIDRLEQAFGTWIVFGMLFLSLTIAFFLVLSLSMTKTTPTL